MSYETPWRSLGDSNPCFRRERAKLAAFRSKLKWQQAPSQLSNAQTSTAIICRAFRQQIISFTDQAGVER